jgi:hypothetical protein
MENLLITENLEIFVDTIRGSIRLELPSSTKVIDILKALAQKINIGAAETYELVFEGIALKPERTLESYDVKTGSRLDLIRETLVA